MPYLLTLVLFFLATLEAKDVGNYGHTFSIAEEDLLLMLQKRLNNAHWDAQKCHEIQNVLIEKIEKPLGINLPKALKIRIFAFDPTICLQTNITDQAGKIIIPKGTKINPLDTAKLNENLLFFDSNDAGQLAWAKTQNGKWILTSGAPLAIEKTENRPVYFDQGGYLTKKLGIRALPAKVSQAQDKLKVEEIPCS